MTLSKITDIVLFLFLIKNMATYKNTTSENLLIGLGVIWLIATIVFHFQKKPQ